MSPKATRRSTRLRAEANSNSQGPSQPVEPVEAITLETDAERELREETQQGKKRKRNTKVKDDSPAEPAPAPKKTKRNGKQKDKKERTDNLFLDLPFDIHLEICSYLGPNNLLSLARTCRDFHQLVASDEFDLVWKNLRKSRFPNMPECPDDMTEPAFFELCFGRGCLVCGKQSTASSPLNLRYEWEARTRICPHCIRTKLERWTTKNPFRGYRRNPSDDDKALADLHDFVPCVWSRSTLANGGAQYYYSPRVIEAWRKEFASQKYSDRENWIAEKKVALAEVKLHSQRCEEWSEAVVGVVHREEDKEILDGRMETILAYIRSLGWGEEMEKLKQTNDHPRNVREFNMICEKKITPKVLEDKRYRFEKYMEWAQRQRLETDHFSRIKRRLKLFKQIYETKVNLLIKPEDPRPRVGDVFAIPRFSERIMDTPTSVAVSAEDFQDLENNLEGVIEEAKDILKQKMLTLVHEGMNDEPYDPETVLDLATTVFCEEAFNFRGTTNEIRTVPEVMAMRVVASNSRSEAKSQLIQKYLGSVPWNTGDSNFKFDKISSDMLGSLLATLGLDPKTTTVREIEELDPIFECVQCNGITDGRLVMKWTQTMKHLKKISGSHGPARDIHQSLGASVFEVLQGEDVTKARSALKEQRLYWLYRSVEVTSATLCQHCPGGYCAPFNKMLWHLNTKMPPKATRRSTRLRAEANSNSQVPSQPAQLMEPRLESDAVRGLQEETQQGSKRKRNIKDKEDAPGSAEPAPAPKKTKRNGKQKDKKERTDNLFLDLPFDIHLEICSYLGPNNLLNLARTCRDFHQLVASDEFDLVWKNLRKSRFPNMPECPDDMTEPAFFELCFGRGCLVCENKSTSSSSLNVYHQWAARTRICLKCIRTKWNKINPFYADSQNPRDDDKALVDLSSFVPRLWSRSTAAGGGGQYYYCRRIIGAWRKEFASQDHSERKKWITGKKAKLEEINLHSHRCRKWHEAVIQAVHDEEDKEILDVRMEMILAYIRSLGWGEEMDKQTKDHPRKVMEFINICQKKVTPKVLEENRHLFEKHMISARRRRLETEYSQCIRRRLPLFKSLYEKKVNLLIKPEDPRPRVSDVFAIPRFSKCIMDTPTDVEVSAANFQDLENNFEGVLEEAKDIVKQKMLALVQEGMNDEPYDPATVLDLATTVFCEKILSYGHDTNDIRTVPEVMTMHVAASYKPKSQLVQEALGGVPWNTGDAEFKFDNKSSDMLGSLLAILGLNPKTTTLREIEELDPIFECVQCNQISEGRLIMTWNETMKHLKKMSKRHESSILHQSVSVFEILQGEDLIKARSLLKDQYQRWLYYGAEVKPVALCRHCPDVYSAPFDKMLWHLNTKHGISYPDEGSYKLVFQSDVRHYPKMQCRLWPPRPPSTGFKD
ncbi:hypothetical protein CVT24_001902 [Panaeolus cyanescens]|uniref:F-box domain-containing protein n=1 Tax=Panaeolus cyanescens TaxID=181874 RepID=A0A409YEK4_9AGAR|nr:hypothetical protein CVT24_001902 [Panaeolus cyanescens]